MIGAGHRLPDVEQYTLAQVRAFLGAIERQQRAVRFGDALAMRMAQAEGKVWKKYIKGLSSDGNT